MYGYKGSKQSNKKKALHPKCKAWQVMLGLLKVNMVYSPVLFFPDFGNGNLQDSIFVSCTDFIGIQALSEAVASGEVSYAEFLLPVKYIFFRIIL